MFVAGRQDWIQTQPYFIVFLILVAFDVVTGIVASLPFVFRRWTRDKRGEKPVTSQGGGLASTIAYAGMVKKVMMIIMAMLAAVLDPMVPNVPPVSMMGISFGVTAGSLVCACFIAVEGISILENAARLGAPIPTRLYNALAKLKGSEVQTVRIVETQTPLTVKQEGPVIVAQNPDAAPSRVTVVNTPEDPAHVKETH